MCTTVPPEPYHLERARDRLAALRALRNPGQSLIDARDVRLAMDFRGVSLQDLGLTGWDELTALEKAAAQADAKELVKRLRSLKPGSTGGSAAAELYDINVHHGIALAALGVTVDELTTWIRADLTARARCDTI